jgi:UDP-glucose 4-epimerase
MKKLLVIGASGSLGAGFIDSYAQEYEIVGTYNSNAISRSDIDAVKLDVTKKDDFSSIPNGIEAVIIFAAAMPAEMSGYDRQRYIDVNITGTLNILEYCRINGIKKVIYIMPFSDVSGSFYTGVPIKESDSRSLNYVGDHAIYSVSKVTACELLEHYHQEYGLQTIIFRIPTVYCCDNKVDYCIDGEPRPKAYISMIRSIRREGKIEVWGEPSNAKDMPYVKDFSRLISKAVEHTSAQGLYNAGTGTPVSLDELVSAMVDVFCDGKAIAKTYMPDKKSQPNFTFDMTKTNDTFSYVPKYNIKEMLVDIFDNIDRDLI